MLRSNPIGCRASLFGALLPILVIIQATSLATEEAFGSCFFFPFDSTSGISKGLIGYRFVCSAEALQMARQVYYLASSASAYMIFADPNDLGLNEPSQR